MNILSVEKISKSYGDKQLFSQISFGLAEGQKAALIARNGEGKSTIFKILMGREVPDHGQVSFRKGIKIGFLEQDVTASALSTVADFIFDSGLAEFALIREYESAIRKYELTHDTGALAQMQLLSDAITNAQCWDIEARVKQILGRLNIHDLDQKFSSLSGGQQKRVALAKVLISKPDILLLDEPTNHLDAELVEWLEDYLDQERITLLLITHDRYFLDNICDTIFELDAGKIFKHEGNYEYYIEKKAEREAALASEQSKDKNLLKSELQWIRRMPKARGTKSKARITAYQDLKDKLTGIRKKEDLVLNVKMNRIGGKVLEFKKVYKQFDRSIILSGFDYTFKTGERIGIVGSNGAGKTTFLNLIAGTELADSGKINLGETVQLGYYSQQGIKFSPEKRVIDIVRDVADVIQLADGSKVNASAFLTLFQFPPAVQHSPVQKLSGGEKRRLYLLTVLIKNPNFLILDEPTNDLDLITLNTLEEFLMNYKGCLIVVSHDRYFLDKMVDHLFVFEGNGKIKDFNGSYFEYRLLQKETAAFQKQINSSEKNTAKLQEVNTSKSKKLSFKEKFEFETLEKEIQELEQEKINLMELLGSSTDHEALVTMSNKIEEINNLLEHKTMRWLTLSEMQA